jgi:hypothetical protein|tara:strand:- start:474 stop:719 length:246 start_codon:yes stop_codon:yes gene_type:complete
MQTISIYIILIKNFFLIEDLTYLVFIGESTRHKELIKFNKKLNISYNIIASLKLGDRFFSTNGKLETEKNVKISYVPRGLN